MKYLIMCSGLLAALFFLTAWFQPMVSFEGVRASSHHYADDFPKVVKPVSATYQSDSIRAQQIVIAEWKYYNAGQWDSLLTASRAEYLISEELLSQRFDSTVFEMWAGGYATYGQALVYLGEINEGVSIMNEAAAIKKRVLGENMATAIEYYGLGHMATHLYDDPEMALDYYRRGEAISRSIRPKGTWNGLINLARGYWNTGQYGTAMKYYHQSLALLVGDGMRTDYLYRDIAAKYSALGDYEQALHYALLAEKQSSTVLHDFERSILLSDIYINLGDLPHSDFYLQRAQRLFDENKERLDFYGEVPYLYSGRADYYCALKNYAQAVIYQKKAVELAELQKGGKSALAPLQLWQQLAQIYIDQGNVANAKSVVNELLFREARRFQSSDFSDNPLLDQFSQQPFHLNTLRLKGQIWELQYRRNPDPAYLHNALSVCLLADSLVDRIRDLYRGGASRDQLAGNAKPIYQHGIQCAYRLWKQTGAAQWLQQAWYFAEKSKALGMLELLRESEARQIVQLNPDDLQLEKILKRDLNYYEKFLFEEQNKAHPDSIRIASWHRRVYDLKTTQDSLLLVFKSRYPEYYRMRYNRSVETMAALQEKLPAESAFVEYFLGDSICYTFLIDRQKVNLFETHTGEGFRQDMKQMHEGVHEFTPAALTTQQQKIIDFQRFTSTSYRLFQTLLEAPLSNTSASRLILAPDEDLGYIPFPALITKPIATGTAPDYRNLPYLVRNYVTQSAYSGTLYSLEYQKGSSGSGQGSGYLGMAPQYTGSPIASRNQDDSLRFTRAFTRLRGNDAPALRYNEEEVLQTAPFGNTVCTGKAATERYFRDKAPDAGVLHLSVHALTNDGDPLFSTLVFAGNPLDTTGDDDGLLHAYELYGLRLNADLAVLSACNTGAGKVVHGEGIMSLARAFKFAGCANIMMSLWPVNDFSGKELVVDFFTKLRSGQGKADALQSAQLHFLSTTPSDEMTHPFYWAAFMLVGDNQPVAFGGMPWWIWGLLIAGVAAAGLWVYRRRGL